MTEHADAEPQQAREPPAATTPPRPLSGWGTAAWGLLAMLAWLAAELIVFLALAVRAYIAHGGVLDVDRLLYDGYVMSSVVIASAAAQCGVVLLAVRRTGWPAADYLGLDRPPWRVVGRALAYVAVLLVASDALALVLGRDILPPFMVKAYQAARESGPVPLLLFAAIVAAPVAEEIMFRGFLFRGWAASRIGITGAIALTAAVWALIHQQYDWFGILQVFCIGVLFGWMRWRSGSTTVTMAAHAFVNTVTTVEAVVIIEYLS